MSNREPLDRHVRNGEHRRTLPPDHRAQGLFEHRASTRIISHRAENFTGATSGLPIAAPAAEKA